MQIAVEVWRVDLAMAPPPSEADLEMLSADERARHARYLMAEPARIFATTRIALRRLLGDRLGMAAATLQIEADLRGKPAVVGMPRPFFNVSHSPGCALIAFSDVAAVGIDVERRRTLSFDTPVAASICSPSEFDWLDANRTSADALLTRLWSRKEAALKASGVGLAHPMRELDLGDPDAIEGVLDAPALGRIAWTDLLLPLAEVGAAAVLSADATAIDVTLRSYASPHSR